VNPRTDSVRTLRGCIVLAKGNDRVHHDFPLSVFPEILVRRERLSENIFAKSSVILDSTGTTSGLMHNNLMMTCENRNVILIYLCLPEATRGLDEKFGTFFQARVIILEGKYTSDQKSQKDIYFYDFFFVKIINFTRLIFYTYINELHKSSTKNINE